ncbi:MAG: hypothetical protein CVV02_05540 [Firmicutes bacterium HGW-Firmicutes-7]|nr:MAG: hypothetical protein CVV02_05540 [Firmicutes bacterium HGW-Firmicutes-7]
MTELFIDVLYMSLTASVVAFFVVIIRLFLKKTPKVFSYALWAIVLFRMVIPFSFESVLSILPRRADVISQNIINEQKLVIDSVNTLMDNPVSSAYQNSALPINDTATLNPMEIITEVGASIWILGIIILIVYSLFLYFQLKLKLRTSTMVQENIYETDRITSPFVMGFIKPKIYLPCGISKNESEYILLHEKVHIKRFDYLIKPLAFLATIIHWFNPFMWISFRLMNRDMEMSCDEKVLKTLGEETKVDYSNTLLSFSVKQSRLISPLAFGEHDTKSRIKNVLNYKKPSFWAVLISAVVIIVMGIGLISNPKYVAKEQTMTEKFLEFKTEYVGDNSKVGGIISLLEFPLGFEFDSFELMTNNQPYGIIVNMKNNGKVSTQYTNESLQEKYTLNALILFSLIGNVEHIEFRFEDREKSYEIQYTREWANQQKGKDIRSFAENAEEFNKLINPNIKDQTTNQTKIKNNLSLVDVQELSIKGEALTWEDFEPYNGENIGSGLYIMYYKIDNEFNVFVGGGSKKEKPHYIILINNNSGNQIDIRTENVEDFLAQKISITDLTEKLIMTYDRYEETKYPLIAELPQEDIYLYGIKPKGVVLKYGERIQIFNWIYTTPRFILPALRKYDIDHDGNDEIICVLNVDSGTGVSIYELHILKENGTTGYTDYQFNDYLAQVKNILSFRYNKKENSILLKIDNNSYTYVLPTEYQKLTFNNIVYKDIVEFDISNDLKINLPLAVVFDEFASPQYLDDLTFEGDIVFENGEFEIKNPQLMRKDTGTLLLDR